MKINLEECENLCLKNCSCTAYAKAHIRKGGRGCYLWFNDLIDIEGYSEDGPGIYIRMAASELALVITREISYNRHTLNEFVAQRTSAYVSQRDRHTAEMTVRETLELSGWCQGFGFKQDMLMELLRREKDLGIEPDDDLDSFVKSIALGDQRTGLVVDYIMKIVGIDDLKKEVDRRGKDEDVTSRTSQSLPRETARKDGTFRKQDIDSLFMEVSQDEALLKKQQSKAYIVEGKSWDDSENDEDEELGNYTLMALEQGESSSSEPQVPTLTNTDLNMNQYKETIEKMSAEMFHIHTSMVDVNEEVSTLTKINEKLENVKQGNKLLIVELEALKQENGYLKNKLKYANEIEAVLREKLEKNELKLKSFNNVSELVGQYHEKNKPCANIVIGLNYDALNSKKKNIRDKYKATENGNVPAMVKKVGSPVFKACEVDFSEEEFIIKQEIADKDNEKKNANSTQSSKPEENLMDNQSTNSPL
ncbi:hypothetical protein AgCh_039212 [Apium graveolens]